MRRLIAILIAVCALAVPVAAQWIAPRANVAAYDDGNDVAKLAYRESPYYLELSGSWKQQRTDSSVIYTRQIDVAKLWRDYRVSLNVRCGRACRVTLNGKEVGYGDDSRHWNEFLLDKFLKYGKANTLSIEALSSPQGALLEDSSIAVGLNGEPFLIFKNDPCVSDFTVLADYETASQMGTLTVEATVFNSKKKGKYYLEVEVWDPQGRQLDRMGRWVLFDNRAEEPVDITRTWGGIEPWTAETPSLYTVVLRLRDEKMLEEETVGARVGFRRVEVKDGQLLVNGHAVTLRGVSYGLEHTEGFASRQQMQRDVMAMKNANVNAVRTVRYSPMDPYFYELCDQQGLYVIADANLMPLSTQRHAVATDKDFAPLFEQRVNNLYGKYKNHTSIVAWSLGLSRDNGVCMAAAYRRLKAIEKHRPVIFSGAESGENTDIIAPSAPTEAILRQLLAKEQERPMVMFPSVFSENFAQLEDLWRLAIANRQLQGGFVGFWPLSSVQLSELKHLYCPVTVTQSKITPDNGEYIVRNLCDFLPLGKFSLDYTIYTTLRPDIISGDLPIASGPGESDKVSMRIPDLDLQPGEEMFIRFNIGRRGVKASERHVGSTVMRLPLKTMAPRRLVNDGDTIPDSIALPFVGTVKLQFEGHPEWTTEVVDSILRHPDSRTVCLDAMLRARAQDGTALYDIRYSYTLFSTGDALISLNLSPLTTRRAPLSIVIPHSGDTIGWFGLDREVIFRRSNSGILGRHSLPATKPFTRQQVGWCAAFGKQGGLFMRIIDRQCTMHADASTVTLTIDADSLRLHLRPYTYENPEDLLAVAYPDLSADIPQPPVITASSPRFSQPLTITLTTDQRPMATEIRYTIDGSEPDNTSPIYQGPFTIAATTVVKARTFATGLPPSFTATRRFNYDHIVAVTHSRKPNTPYNLGTDTILFDGLTSTADDLAHGWLGFSGNPPQTTVQLAKPIDIQQVTLRYAHNPALWAFAPQRVTILLSSDGETYTDTVTYDNPLDPADQSNAEPRVVEMQIPVSVGATTAIRIEVQTLARIPAWHRAKGLNPWLLTDEIQIIEK